MYVEPYKTSKMNLFAKIVYFLKKNNFILDV